ncbi:MAG: alkaline phosphatase D family protein [Pyrinomonadaceae bacterium]|nr:alkaline phosphatase D family protein [Pyrinomonadaceae bacterium]
MSNIGSPPACTAHRRRFLLQLLKGATASAAFALLNPFEAIASAPAIETTASFNKHPKFKANPFTLGVASGDPLADGFVLWTRLAPEPLSEDGRGGMMNETIALKWRIATDEKMQRIVKRGTALAAPQLAHSIHVEVHDLKPARDYFYQFTAGAFESEIGRAKTAPARSANVERLAFAFASCQHYEDGYYTALHHLAQEDLDFVIHLGDYIYENGISKDRPRRHNSDEPTTLAGYRNRYALYKSDRHLQAAHKQFAWIVTWDDHEVDNNYAGAIDQDDSPPAEFLQRRAAAYQAYYEHLPLRRSSLPVGAQMQLYRRLTFGTLAEFNVLDTRQYRTDQPCGDGVKVRCAAALDERATLTGPAQERWLLDGLGKSRARWNVVAQQLIMAQFDVKAGAAQEFNMDNWSGYVAGRNRLIGYMLRARPSNPIVISGDIHANFVNDIKADFTDERSPTVATEFVGTSISSGGDGYDQRPESLRRLAENPHVKFHNAQRGYVRCTLTPQTWQTDYRVVESVTKPSSAISTRATFVVESGTAGAKKAEGESC